MTPADHANRHLAARHAFRCRDRVRQLRRAIRVEGAWKACQVGWFDELDAAREEWREALWAMNWSAYEVRRAA